MSATPVFDAIFPHQYFLGTYLGIPFQPKLGILPRTKSKDNDHYHLYGWINPSLNISSAKQTNDPMGFSFIPNQLEFNEGVAVFEKLPDTLSHQYDFGFNLTNLYGIDYRYSLMKGVFSQQFIQQNLIYGDDPMIFNAQFYLPNLGNGALVTVGRFLAPGDIESPLANDNYLVSHSLSFVYSAFTQMGVNFNTPINANWSLYLGFHFGSDNAIWSQSGQPSGSLFLQYVTPSQKDSLWIGANSINNGQYRNDWNNLQQINLIWTHQFTPDLFIETGSYYEYQFNALDIGSCSFAPSASANCTRKINGLSNSFSILSYVQKKWTENDFSSLRLEFFDDFQGQRTGYIAPYFEFTLGLTHKVGNVLKIRPEVRYDVALQSKPYDNGNANSLVLGLVDLIVLL